ncbi:hypothetical protein NLJ89_g6432 [Agrocybe chaxingu]|uniref:Uncharacterized protein n=1 Tax=Agrocybe chaxingu TaxID=84603 RepID=A0A9W8JZ62_9AGAR|nr:hypothetical protein NLJ89_g6432 [Agrocybe chaxingu]
MSTPARNNRNVEPSGQRRSAPLFDATKSSLMFNHCNFTQWSDEQRGTLREVGTEINELEGFKILYANVDKTLLYDSIDRDPEEMIKPHSNEERQIINQIVDWTENAAHETQAAVLYSPAQPGGVSTIGHSLSELCRNRGSLLASILLPSNAALDKTEDAKLRRHVVATLAYEIALAFPAARPFIEDAVEHDPAIFRRSLRSQIERLIQEPLRHAADTPLALFQPSSSVIILDGLDPGKDWHRKLLEHLHPPASHPGPLATPALPSAFRAIKEAVHTFSGAFVVLAAQQLFQDEYDNGRVPLDPEESVPTSRGWVLCLSQIN